MAKPNNESCQSWYQKMRQDKAKLEAYRIRKRDWQRKNRGYSGGQNKRSNQEPKRFQEDFKRESGSQQLDQVVREPASEATANEALRCREQSSSCSPSLDW